MSDKLGAAGETKSKPCEVVPSPSAADREEWDSDTVHEVRITPLHMECERDGSQKSKLRAFGVSAERRAHPARASMGVTCSCW